MYTKLVIFDCDGTLVDSQHIIMDAMRETFAANGVAHVSDAAVRSTVGLSLDEAIKLLVPQGTPDHIAELVEAYKSTFYRLRVEQDSGPDPLYEGTREALTALDKAGYLLGVATGNSRRGLDRILKEHDLADMFVTLQTADGHPSKPHPSMVLKAVAEAGSTVENTVMVGDTSYDMLMGCKAGAHSLGVNWGYHAVDELLEAGAKHVASDYAEIPALVRTWVGETS
ncbi:MAG: HAD-IA family hydrolase [Kordiimonadaceae bacterium]|nr:HAD-IA family hydrolase [Kordiimonadaceae bacterium]